MGLFQLKWTKYGFWGALPKVIRKLIERRLDAFTLRMLQWAYRSANFNFKDTKSTPWFVEACAGGYSSFIETTQLNIDIWSRGFSAACAGGHSDCVGLLWKWKIPKDHHMQQACNLAAMNGHFNVVHMFPRDVQLGSLEVAIKCHQYRLIERILDGASLPIAFRDICIRYDALELFQTHFLEHGPLGLVASYYFCPQTDNTRTLKWLFERNLLKPDSAAALSRCVGKCHVNAAAFLFDHFGEMIDCGTVLQSAFLAANFTLADWIMSTKRPVVDVEEHVHHVLTHFSDAPVRGILSWAHKHGVGFSNTRFSTALMAMNKLHDFRYAVCKLRYPWDRAYCVQRADPFSDIMASILHREGDCPNNYHRFRVCGLSREDHDAIMKAL